MGDWGSATYVTSQVFVSIAYALLAATYFITGRQKQLATVITSNVTMGIGLLLLGGYVGVGMCLVAISRDLVSNAIHRRKKAGDKDKILRTDWWWLALWTALLTIVTIFTADGFASLFAYFATLTFTISIWQKNGFIYRLMGILVGLLWMIYNIYLQSFMGTLLESALLIFVIAGFITYSRKQKK